MDKFWETLIYIYLKLLHTNSTIIPAIQIVPSEDILHCTFRSSGMVNCTKC